MTGAEFSEQGSTRPVIVIQNDTGNRHSPTTIVVPLTSEIKKRTQPTHAIVPIKSASGLTSDSMALCEQVRTIDKRRLQGKIGSINDKIVMRNIFNAYMANIGEA